MKKLTYFLLLALAFGHLSTSAQTALNEIRQDIRLSASNYVAYRSADAARQHYTHAPKGYTPCYISGYARHGSRWLIDGNDYASPSRKLHRADSLGILTPLGKHVMAVCDSMKVMSRGRLGELTDMGAIQHRGIGQRMAAHWPEVFQKGAFVEARSTDVVRCILSMMNELWSLKAAYPTLDMRCDGSVRDRDEYLNSWSHPCLSHRNDKAADESYRGYFASLPDPTRLNALLFTDTLRAHDVVNCRQLRDQLFDLASNMQSHGFSYGNEYWNLYDALFTPEEAHELWLRDNWMWYLYYGHAPLTQGMLPYMQSDLLRNFIATADTCLTKKHPGATLRFGHEVCVLPLVCLMGLDGYDCVATSPTDLAAHWRNYDIFTMASNVQLIFFRNKKGHILVKPLLNEREVTLPVPEYAKGFYDWQAVKTYWLQKLQKA